MTCKTIDDLLEALIICIDILGSSGNSLCAVLVPMHIEDVEDTHRFPCFAIAFAIDQLTM
jgi:hypothetical protein